MNGIVFIDTEIETKSKRILDLGGINEIGVQFHSASKSGFIGFVGGYKLYRWPFELNNPNKKHQSDFEAFVRESKLDDFISTSGDTFFLMKNTIWKD
jgi:hypothetical protein